MKKKIEAFERHANARQSPAAPAPRQTRTKTRAKQEAAAAIVEDSADSSSAPETEPPSRSVVAAIGSKFNTPLGGAHKLPLKLPLSASAASYGGQLHSSGIPTPTSKLAHISRSANKIGSLQREQSVEDMKRGLQVIIFNFFC